MQPDPTCGALYQVTAPHFIAGLIVAPGGRIVRAPPIMSWARGKPFDEVARSCDARHWRILKVTEVGEQNLNERPSQR